MTNCNKCATCQHQYTPKEISFPDLLNQYDKILIPKIQRDYAQGRNDSKAKEVRKNLLDDIFNEKEVKFDFIFGTKQEIKEGSNVFSCFIPLDGQQRLTTLFLLYLYGIKTHKIKEKVELFKFSYDTRRASRDFCNEFVNDNNNWIIPINQKLSDCVKNSIWFLDYWQYDPTVSSMLNMLDDIHKRTKNASKYPDLENIKFYFFDLDEHNLNENLYLKMNSRGKPLTVFENFKAAVDKMLPDDKIETESNPFFEIESEDSNLKKLTTFDKKWQYCIDKQWTEFFWNYKEDFLVDAPFMYFVSNFLVGYWVSRVKEVTKKDDNGNDILGDDKKPIYILGKNGKDAKIERIENNNVFNELLSFKINKESDFISFDIFREVFELENTFQTTVKILSDCYKNKETIFNNSKPGWNSKFEIFDRVKPNEDYRQRAIFFALTQYSKTNYDSESFQQWIRFAWNIAENNVSAKESYISFCKMIGKLSKKSDSILKFLSEIDLDTFKKQISEFASEQVQEEMIKAKLVTLSDLTQKWGNLIYQAERHELFRGSIRFLFNDYPNFEMTDISIFEKRWNNARKMFDKNGVNENYKKTLLRAFVSRINIWRDNSGWMFTFDNTADNWRKILSNYRFSNALKCLLEIEGDKDLDIFINGDSTFSEESKRNEIHKYLYSSDLLNNIVKGCNFRDNDQLRPYGSRTVYVVYKKRNQLLFELSNEIESTKLKKDNEFFVGKDILFSWAGKDVSWIYPNQLRCNEVVYYTDDINDLDSLKKKLNELTSNVN